VKSARTAMAFSDRISIYAELFSNLRMVTVTAELPSPPDASTRAKLSPDGSRLKILHRGDEEDIQLPGSVEASSALPITNSPANALLWRLPLSSLQHGQDELPLESESVPWAASDLERGSPVACGTCNALIVAGGAVAIWKDLPSENWAEMMEFWHCHKPDAHDGHHQDDENLTGRGYGANSAISARPGTGLVDLTSLLFAESDTKHLKVSFAIRLSVKTTIRHRCWSLATLAMHVRMYVYTGCVYSIGTGC
jgi:ubiquitin-protein ligase E3 D